MARGPASKKEVGENPTTEGRIQERRRRKEGDDSGRASGRRFTERYRLDPCLRKF
jgi:hypothetical protein